MIKFATLKWPQRLETVQQYKMQNERELFDDLSAICEPCLHPFIQELMTDRVAADVEELHSYFHVGFRFLLSSVKF